MRAVVTAACALALAGCGARAEPAAKNFSDGELDAPGRALLAPVRALAIKPDALIARLAIAPGAVVADVGAGPGFLTNYLARAVPSGRVIATDVRADYLREAARRVREARLGNVETRLVEAAAPSLAADSVDLAVLCQVDQYLPDRARYLQALKASLRARGRIALINFQEFRAADLEAARVAGLRVADEWSPSAPMFVLVLARSDGGG